MPAATALGQRLLDLLFPPRCGRSLAARHAVADGALPRCPFCASGDQPVFLTTLRAASVYEGAARAAIRALKLGGQRRLAGPLGELLAAAYRREGLRADLIVPVRLHRLRRREHGYDQATFLARELAGQLRLPLRADLLIRLRATQPQTALSGAPRRANVAGAFALSRSVARQAIMGKRVLLVDDVTTTGSTLDAAASALAAGQPAASIGLAVARPPLDHLDRDDTVAARHAGRTAPSGPHPGTRI
jgi:ComF family protein